MRGDIYSRAVLVCSVAAAMFVIPAGPATAADLYWSGDGNWSTADANWGTIPGGPYDATAWVSDSNATFEGTPGTVTLTEDITVTDITFPEANYGYVIAGDYSLNFAAGGSINNAKTMVNTLTCGIAGSPAVNQEEWSHVPRQGELKFLPTGTNTQTLGLCTVPYNDPGHAGDKAILTLGGTTIGNSVSEVTYGSGMQYGTVNKIDSGTWTLGDVNIGTVSVNDGHLIANGKITTKYGHLQLNGGVFHYNDPNAYVSGQFRMQGGSLDNTSGAAITAKNNISHQWSASGFTFIGSNGALSDLDLGTGAVTLTGNATVTIQDAATTLTVGGAVGDGTNIYGMTKAGDGTLVLTGSTGYDGATTVSAGTLSLGDGTNSTGLGDGTTVAVAGSALLNLNFASANVDDVFYLVLDGNSAAPGKWGAIGSVGAGTADYESALLTGTGILNTAGGVYSDGRFYWDGPNTGGTGDAVSDGGSGTWSTTNDNWDKGFTAKQAWVNGTSKKAIFGSASDGTVTLGEDITVEEIEFAGTNNNVDYTVQGNTLNFTGAKAITGVSGRTVTITSGITGKPTINFDHSAGNNGKLTLAPAGSATMDLGTINMIKGPLAGNTALILGGDTDNSADAITWSNVGQQLTIYKQGTGTWTVGGNYDNGPNGDSRVRVQAGALILTGAWNPSHQFDVESGGTISGTGSIARAGADATGPIIKSGGTIAPGIGVGTLTVADSLSMDAGSIYEWEFDGVGDLIPVAKNLTLTTGWKLKLIDLGEDPDAGMEYNLFTYTGTCSFSQPAWNADLAPDWDVTGLSVVHDSGAKRVYITGIGITGVDGDTNDDGIVDAADFMTVKQNFGQTIGGGASVGDFDETGTVDWTDLSTLMANMGAGGPAPATIPEPATLGLLALGALTVVRRRRRK